MSAPSPKKSLKDRVKSARFAFRDVDICMDGALVVERERALAEVLASGQDVQRLSRDAATTAGDLAPDERMGQKPAFVVELEDALEAAQSLLADARGRVDDIEQQMRDDLITLRFTAVPKARFREIQAESETPAEIYSALARESGKHVNGDTAEDIDGDVWDMLEESMTAGQWQQIVAALDEVNITMADRRLDFLERGSKKTQS